MSRASTPMADCSTRPIQRVSSIPTSIGGRRPRLSSAFSTLTGFQAGSTSFDAAERSWAFIEKYIVDHEHGEWFWRVSKSGVPSTEQYKVDPWKCPYHNSRVCFEVMERLAASKPAEARQ
jgi:hypothetical protein